MSELKPCPVCRKDAHKFMGYDHGKVGCRNQACNYRNRPQYPDDWNNRPYENKIKADAVREAIDKSCVYAINFSGKDTRFIKQSTLEDYANKLERGEWHDR